METVSEGSMDSTEVADAEQAIADEQITNPLMIDDSTFEEIEGALTTFGEEDSTKEIDSDEADATQDDGLEPEVDEDEALEDDGDSQDDDYKDEGDMEDDELDDEDEDSDDLDDDDDESEESDDEELLTEQQLQEYEMLTGPIKANGRTYENLDVEDRVRIMQQGLNYDHKMRAMKPGLNVLKVLEKNGIMNPDGTANQDMLNQLMDIKNGDVDAIRNLVKGAGINEDDMYEGLDELEYESKDHSIDDKEMAYTMAIDSIDGKVGSDITKTVLLGSQSEGGWDENSQMEFIKQPNLVEHLRVDIENGKFDKISAAVDIQRSRGNLLGETDLQAYLVVADAMKEAGELDSREPVTKQAKAKPVVKTTKKQKPRGNKGKAGVTKTGSQQKAEIDFNPLSMSDEEWEKYEAGGYS